MSHYFLYEQLYEGNKKTLLTQTLHHKSPKIALQKKTCFAQEVIVKLLCDNNLNAALLLFALSIAFFLFMPGFLFYFI